MSQLNCLNCLKRIINYVYQMLIFCFLIKLNCKSILSNVYDICRTGKCVNALGSYSRTISVYFYYIYIYIYIYH